MCTIMVTLKMELMKMGSIWKSRALLVTWPLQVIDLAIAILVYTQDMCVYVCPKRHAEECSKQHYLNSPKLEIAQVSIKSRINKL